jgi:threonine dehydrogenase-like Zn-dependent dehydrogenase
MRAAVTEGRRAMRVVEVPDPGEPGPGEVLVRPEAVGLCGSDFHYFLGDIADALGVELYPRVQGHEAAGTLEAVGPDCPPQLRPGQRVALWPLVACGRCYACRVGRDNVCANINLIGIHRDGMLQDLLRVPASQVFPVDTEDPALAALIEPVSIAVRAVGRGRVEPGEKAVVFGAGPIGQAVAIAVTDRGGTALLVDRVWSRVERGKVTGAELLTLEDGVDVVAATREWAGDDGPQLVFEATGVPEVARTAVELVSQAGRVVIVGLSGHDAPFRVGDLAFKEIDLLGVSCCNAGEFVDAVDLVGRRADALAGLVTHQFALEETPGAIAYAMEHPAEVMKAVIRLEDSA